MLPLPLPLPLPTATGNVTVTINFNLPSSYFIQSLPLRTVTGNITVTVTVTIVVTMPMVYAYGVIIGRDTARAEAVTVMIVYGVCLWCNNRPGYSSGPGSKHWWCGEVVWGEAPHDFPTPPLPPSISPPHLEWVLVPHPYYGQLCT
eukprot:gene15071-biopygen424